MAALGEFELIRRYFDTRPRARQALLGIGDDCALLAAPGPEVLAISTDMLVAGRHFFDDVDPRALGHKALAVNLSDLAAMGARPQAFTLALALPEVDTDWLAGFSQGLLALAESQGCELIGGDTTRGPLCLSLTVIGAVPASQALRRDAAQCGDDLWVSGSLGAAAWAVQTRMGLGAWPGDDEALAAARRRLEWPTPRLALGQALRGQAHAAIDLSDGLAGDLGHVLTASAQRHARPLGALIEASALPIDPALARRPISEQLHWALTGGDDYELLFTAPASARAAIARIGEALPLPLARIGHIDAVPGLRLRAADGTQSPLAPHAFDHFR